MHFDELPFWKGDNKTITEAAVSDCCFCCLVILEREKNKLGAPLMKGLLNLNDCDCPLSEDRFSL